MHRAVVIDDEPPARRALRVLLAEQNVTILGEAGTLRAGRELLAQGGYNIVFLDLQLRGGNGFDLMAHVQPDAVVVFVTAHLENAVAAFERNAIDYLLKPVCAERLAAALSRLEPRPLSDGGALPAGRLRPDDRIYVRTAEGARLLLIAALGSVRAWEYHAQLDLITGERLLVRRTVDAWAETLPTPPFARVAADAIVNLDRVWGVEDDGGPGPLLHIEGSRSQRASGALWDQVARRVRRR